ncbi:hypothetical protein HmCmsJML007_02825 [Escherichia coli]|nr:hypothetical protein HmCmsJML007_02825 [Escherichia coli]
MRSIQLVRAAPTSFPYLSTCLDRVRIIVPNGINCVRLVSDGVIHIGEGVARLTYRATVCAQTIELLR